MVLPGYSISALSFTSLEDCLLACSACVMKTEIISKTDPSNGLQPTYNANNAAVTENIQLATTLTCLAK